MKNALLFLTLFLSQASAAEEGSTITANFHGTVYETACEIEPASANQIINLNGAQGQDEIYNTDLERKGQSSPWVRFDIRLIHCPVATQKVTAHFSGTPDGQFYKNIGSAKNVAIELQGIDGTVLSNGSKKEIAVDTNSRTATFNLQTHAIATGAATAGDIEAVIQILFNYE